VRAGGLPPLNVEGAAPVVIGTRRKMSVGTLSELVGVTPANLAVLKNGRAKAVRSTTLEALCVALDCQPGDLLRWEAESD
jgi:putative transcriptional regulator